MEARKASLPMMARRGNHQEATDEPRGERRARTASQKVGTRVGGDAVVGKARMHRSGLVLGAGVRAAAGAGVRYARQVFRVLPS